MKEDQEFENLKNLSERILEEKDSILEKAEKEHPETKRLENLVNEKIEQIRNRWEKDGEENYKRAVEAKQEINYYKEHPEQLDREIWHSYAETLRFLSDKDKGEKNSELKEKKMVELSDRTTENYLKKCEVRLAEFKQELDNLPSMNLEIFKDKIYDKSPGEIKELNDANGKPVTGAYSNEWYNAIFNGQKMLSWKELPIESSRKLFFYEGYVDPFFRGYKEYNERKIEIIEADLNGFLKAAIKNKDIESTVDSAILLNKLDNPKITSFVKEQMEELQKSLEKADKEKLINISEKISGIKKKQTF